MNFQDILNLILGFFNGSSIPATPIVDPTMHLEVQRLTKTSDGIFGKLYINKIYECDTVESLVHALPANTYTLSLYNSPDHGCICPLLDTSAIGRTYCELHIANYPSQLLGCIGLGSSIDGDGVDASGTAFTAFMKKFTLPANITIVENYSA